MAGKGGIFMRVVLEITGGPNEGNRILLVPHQTLHVGRTERADLAIAQDPRLSSVHFEISVNEVGCLVRDLQSTNGTWLNGEPVEQALLKDGDIVVAGESEFRVRIEGGDLRAAQTYEAMRTVVDEARSRAVDAAQFTSPASYQAEMLATELLRCWGATSEVPPELLAERLGQIVPMHLVVDVGAVDWTAAELPLLEMGDSYALYDWLPEEAQKLKSPRVIARSHYARAADLIKKLWGSNALLCVYSVLPAKEVAARLRSAMFRGRDYQPGRAIVGCCWPNVLAYLLAHDGRLVVSLLANIDAVFFETPNDPEHWQLFGHTVIAEYLRKAGVTKQVEPGNEKLEVASSK